MDLQNYRFFLLIKNSEITDETKDKWNTLKKNKKIYLFLYLIYL